MAIRSWFQPQTENKPDTTTYPWRPNMTLETLKRFPLELAKNLKMIQEEIARSGASVGLSLAGKKEITSEELRPGLERGFKELVFGKRPLESVGTRIAKTKESLQKEGLPLLGTLGRTEAGILAPIGVLGTIALDFTGWGGGKSQVIKLLAKTKNIGEVSKILKGINVADDLIPAYAVRISKMGKVAEVETALNKLQEIQKTTKVTKPITGAVKTVPKIPTAPTLGKVAPRIAPEVQKGLPEAIPAQKGIIPQEFQPLAQEAKKYKSAEEFVRNQTPIFHRTKADFDIFDITKKSEKSLGLHFFGTRAEADKIISVERFGGKVVEAYPQGRIADLGVRNVSLDLVDIANLRGQELRKALESKGYVGFKMAEEIVIFDPKNVLTKSQLTDFFTQAVKGVEKTGEKLGITSAEKAGLRAIPKTEPLLTRLREGAIIKPETLQEIAKYAEDHKGITVKLADGKIATEGYSVSILDKAGETRLPIGGNTKELFIEQFNKLKKQYANSPNIHMGGWVEGGDFVVDVTRVRTKLKESLYDAIIKRQDAAGDLAKYAKNEDGTVYITPEILRSLKPLSRGSLAVSGSVFRSWEEAIKYYGEKGFKNAEGFVLPQEITRPTLVGAEIPSIGKPPFELAKEKPILQQQIDFINKETNKPIINETELPAIMDINVKKGPTNFVRPPQLVKTEKEAVAELKYEKLGSYPEIQLDTAAQKFNETFNFDDFVNALPQAGIKEGFPMRKTRGGKEIPAVRKSGIGVSKEFAEYKGFKDVPQTFLGGFKSPLYLVQEIDGGISGGPTFKMLMTAYHTENAADNFVKLEKATVGQRLDFYKLGKKVWRKDAGKVAEAMDFDDMEKGIVELLEMPKIAEIVKKYPKDLQQRIVAFGAEGRNLLKEYIRKRNIIKTKRGEKLIPERVNYIPHVREQVIWTKLNGLKPFPEEALQRPGIPLFIKPNQPTSFREMARKADMPNYEREFDLEKLLNDYIEDTAKKMFNPYIVDLGKEHARMLESLGIQNSANAIENLFVESYAGIRTGLSRMLGLPKIVTAPLFKIRSLLSSSTFGANLDWSLGIQTSSYGLVVLRTGIRNSAWGAFKYLFDSSFRHVADKNSWIIAKKMKEAGVMAYQDLGENFVKKYAGNKSFMGRVNYFANFLTQTIEKNMTGMAVASGYHKGMKMGLRGQALWDYASEIGAKTQSMYHLSGLPGALRTREIGALAPFQTFAFEMLNTVREMGWLMGKAKTGAWKQVAANSIEGQNLLGNRLKMLAEFIGVMYVTNLVVDKAMNRKPWNVSSFVPFYSLLTGGVNAGNPWGYPLPTRYTYEAYKGLSNVIKYGDWKKLRSFMIKYHAIGGIQMDRMLTGFEAVSEGKVTDVTGKEMFGVDEDEWLSALIHGPYGTKEGREYIDQLEKSRGGLPSEILGIPLPIKVESKTKTNFMVPGVSGGGVRSWAR